MKSAVKQLVYVVRQWGFELVVVVDEQGRSWLPQLQMPYGRPVYEITAEAAMQPTPNDQIMYYYTTSGHTFVFKNIPGENIEEFKTRMYGCGVDIAVVKVHNYLPTGISPQQYLEMEADGWMFTPKLQNSRLVFMPKRIFAAKHKLPWQAFAAIGAMYSGWKVTFADQQNRSAITVASYDEAIMANHFEDFLNHLNTIDGEFRIASLRLKGRKSNGEIKWRASLHGLGDVKVQGVPDHFEHGYAILYVVSGRFVVFEREFDINWVIDEFKQYTQRLQAED